MNLSRPGVIAVLIAATACSGGSGPRAVATTSPRTTTTTPPAVASPSPRQLRLQASVVGRLADPVSRAVAVELGSRIMVLGGLTTGDVTTGRVVAVSPGSWTSAVCGALRDPVHDASGAALARHAAVFGGGAASEMAATQWWTGGTSRVVGSLPAPRSDSAATTIGSTAYVVGGFDGTHMTRAVLATTNGRTFRVVARLRQGVRYPAVTAFGGAIYVFGGQLATTEGTSSGAQSRLVQRIDPSTGRTRVIGRLPWGIGHAMAFSLDHHLYLAGGRRTTQATRRIWNVDPTTARLVAAGRLPHPISDSAVVGVGASVVLIGGETTGPFAPQSTIVDVRPH